MQIKNNFDRESIVKIIKGAFIAGGGVAMVYVLEAVARMDFGQATALVVGIASILINSIKEFLAGVKPDSDKRRVGKINN